MHEKTMVYNAAWSANIYCEGDPGLDEGVMTTLGSKNSGRAKYEYMTESSI